MDSLMTEGETDQAIHITYADFPTSYRIRKAQEAKTKRTLVKWLEQNIAPSKRGNIHIILDTEEWEALKKEAT